MLSRRACLWVLAFIGQGQPILAVEADPEPQGKCRAAMTDFPGEQESVPLPLNPPTHVSGSYLQSLLNHAAYAIAQRPHILRKITLEQLATPVSLLLWNPHDPHFLLKWMTLAFSRATLVWENARVLGERPNKNIFDTTVGEGLRMFLRKCSLQGATGIVFGGATKALETLFYESVDEAASSKAEAIAVHAGTSFVYFFAAACVRYQALDKINSKITDRGWSPASAQATMGGLYLANAVGSTAIFGVMTDAENDLLRRRRAK